MCFSSLLGGITQGWYCYDLQGAQKNTSGHIALVDKANTYHTGTIPSNLPCKVGGKNQ